MSAHTCNTRSWSHLKPLAGTIITTPSHMAASPCDDFITSAMCAASNSIPPLHRESRCTRVASETESGRHYYHRRHHHQQQQHIQHHHHDTTLPSTTHATRQPAAPPSPTPHLHPTLVSHHCRIFEMCHVLGRENMWELQARAHTHTYVPQCCAGE